MIKKLQNWSLLSDMIDSARFLPERKEYDLHLQASSHGLPSVLEGCLREICETNARIAVQMSRMSMMIWTLSIIGDDDDYDDDHDDDGDDDDEDEDEDAGGDADGDGDGDDDPALLLCIVLELYLGLLKRLLNS